MAPNKKKKKAATNPARGFATVSVPSSRARDDQIEESDQKAVTEDTKSQSIPIPEHNGVDGKKPPSSGPSTNDMTPEQLEQHLETSELRLMVEKHGPKVKRDIARQVKALETDRRLLRLQSTPLDGVSSLSEELVTKVMDLVKNEPVYPMIASPLPTAASGLTPELDLCIKVWTLYETLAELRFPVIDAAVKHILAHTNLVPSSASSAKDAIWGLEEALYWYAINAEEQDLPQFDRAQTVTSQPTGADDQVEEELLKMPQMTPKKSLSSKSSSKITTPSNITDVSSSDSDEGADPPSIPQYIELQTRLFTLQTAASSISREIQSENREREVRKLSAKIARIERDPLFDRRGADIQWKSSKQALDIEAAQARAKERVATESDSDISKTALNLPDESERQQQDVPNDTVDFAGLFELGDNLPDTADSAPGPAVILKDFGKWSGTSPRKVLEDVCKARDARCRVVFKLVSSSFHSCRHQIEIIWSKDIPPNLPSEMLLPETVLTQERRKTTLMMQEIATSTTIQSEAYAATVMLFAISADGQQGERPNVRLPTVWRHLWNDLTDRKSEYELEQNVRTLGEIRAMVREHILDIERRQVIQDKTSTQRVNGSDMAKSDLNGDKTRSMEPSLLQDLWRQKASTPAYKNMLTVREQLPVYKQKDEFIDVFNKQQLMILCGETGSGKSTQTPALILENELLKGKDCKILCTQPRRISAMSLAGRVSEELGEPKGDLGTMRSLVGYAIRLESKVSAATRLTYATTGVAMRLLERQDNLADINVLLIDEVHERNIDSDFLLIVLRRLLPRRPDLKVVLMSATIDANRFSAYLNGCPILMVPGRLFPVKTMFLEDAIEATNSLPSQQTMGIADYEDDDEDDITDIHSHLQNLQGYSEKTISTLRRLNEYRIDIGLITKVAVAISSQPELNPYSKAILIFMPGIGEIRRLHQTMSSYPQFQRGWIFHILHSTVSTEDQQAAFRVPPPGIRKIVIATNIAETGITIPDITAVIDTGKEKIMRFDERRQVSRLTESFISKASSRQRQGRAARVQEGLCVKLYTRDRFERLMPDHSTPEILRLSLSETILRVKLCALGSIEASLSEALDPPLPKNVRRAIEALKEDKVLTSSEDLTPMGRQLARLPLDIPLGKLVLNGLAFNCLDVMSSIAALLSSKSPFITSAKNTTTVDTVRRSFARGDSDLLLLFNVYEAWKQAETNETGATFCQKTLLSRQTLSLIEDQKMQLLSHLGDAGLLVLSDSERASLQSSRFKGRKRSFFIMPTRYNSNCTNDDIINAAIALSFYPKLLRKEGRGWRNISTNQSVTLSPQSINKVATLQSRWLSFYQTMQTKSQGLSVSETSVVDEMSIALLVGDADFKLFSGTMTLDSNRVRFSVRSWRAILALKELRSKLKMLLIEGAKAPDRSLSAVERQWADLFYALYK